MCHGEAPVLIGKGDDGRAGDPHGGKEHSPVIHMAHEAGPIPLAAEAGEEHPVNPDALESHVVGEGVVGGLPPVVVDVDAASSWTLMSRCFSSSSVRVAT
jgi:hypothetical protein